MAAMRKELASSGLSEEEIFTKTMLLQKALAGDNSPAFVNKTIKSALDAAHLTPNDLAKVSFEQIAQCSNFDRQQTWIGFTVLRSVQMKDVKNKKIINATYHWDS